MSFLTKLLFGAPDSTRENAQAVMSQITGIYDELRDLESLEPCAQVNELLTNLVRLCASTQDQTVVDMVLESRPLQRILPGLRDRCSTAEFHLESHWARSICNGEGGRPCDIEDAWDRLRAFPYFDNYVDLVRIELAVIYTELREPPTRIAYFGSGPLPLTSFCLLRALADNGSPWGKAGSVNLLNVDRSAEAIAESEALATDLGLVERGMRFMAAEAADEVVDLRGFQVVCLAALVGVTQEEKEALLCNMAGRMDVGALLVTRSAEGLRRCLYPELQITARLLEWLEICLVLHPHGQVINSVVVARIKPRPLGMLP